MICRNKYFVMKQIVNKYPYSSCIPCPSFANICWSSGVRLQVFTSEYGLNSLSSKFGTKNTYRIFVISNIRIIDVVCMSVSKLASIHVWTIFRLSLRAYSRYLRSSTRHRQAYLLNDQYTLFQEMIDVGSKAPLIIQHSQHCATLCIDWSRK